MDTINIGNQHGDKHGYRRLSTELKSSAVATVQSAVAASASTSPDQAPAPALQRSRSVRASFRMLGARWKSATPSTSTASAAASTLTVSKTPRSQPAQQDFAAVQNQQRTSHRRRSNSVVVSTTTTTTTVLSVIPPPDHGSADHSYLPAFPGTIHSAWPAPATPTAKQRFERQFLQYRGDNFGRAKKKKQLKRSGTIGGLRTSKENWLPPMDDLPAHIPSKAAAILEIPVSAEQFNRRTAAWLRAEHGTAAPWATVDDGGGRQSCGGGLGGPGSAGHLKLLKRSVSLNEEAAKAQGGANKPPRTATIRRGSVWANSTLKLALPDLVTKFTSSTPAKTAKLPPPASEFHTASVENPTTIPPMEFLLPQLPVSANGRSHLLHKGSGSLVASSSSSSASSNGQHSTSGSSSARKNANNGSILQSALNSLNSRHSSTVTGQAAAAAATHSASQHRYSQLPLPPVPSATSTSTPQLYTKQLSTCENRSYLKQKSVSHITAAMSAMTMQSTSAATISMPHSASVATPAASTSSAADPLMPPPPAPPKMTKKQLKLAQAQLDKLTQINIHLHALFAAVENGHLDKARTILESTDVDVNSLNSDGLSPLDVAVLSNNRSMTKMLLQHGAIESKQFKSADSLGNHLNALLHDAESRVYELSGSAGALSTVSGGGGGGGGGSGGAGAYGGAGEDGSTLPLPPFSTRASFSSIIGNAYAGPSTMGGCTGTEADKQIGLWERRIKGLRRMLLGWEQAKPPDAPHAIHLDVTSCTSVVLRIQEAIEGPIATKCKVQWSARADFSHLVGECDVNEWTSFQGTMGASCRIADLTHGRRYFFRANCGNVKGWGAYRISAPSSVIPSSWRDMEHKEPRFAGRQRMLDELFTAVRMARPEDASEFPLETAAIQRRNPKKKTTIKQLFSAASKFQKNLRRGIYMACIIYHEDKVLVTNEDFVPVIEIDETYPSTLTADYYWLMKVACTWDDVKSLRTDMEKNATSVVHFRNKLLSAACQMQSALGLQDLGQLFHRILRDAHGTIVLSCVNHVKTPKCVSVLNSRWMPLNKVQKKIIGLQDDNHINEILLSSIQEQIAYHQASTVRLSRGLYLGYLKMQSSVDQIQVVVPSKTPNVLPHCKLRDNPHISAEEWEFLRRNKSGTAGPTTLVAYEPPADRPTEVQTAFIEALSHTAIRLFRYMDIAAEPALAHRLFDLEVIELSPDVSLLVVVPPPDTCCAVPGQRELLLQRGDMLSLPLQAFEMIHLRTYHNGIIQKYARLSCILELDTMLANHSHRQAFSSLEVNSAKERLAKLQELTKNLNAVWKGVRWLMDVTGFARDRCGYLGVSIREIYQFDVHKEQMAALKSAAVAEELASKPQADDRLAAKQMAGECGAAADSSGDAEDERVERRQYLLPPATSGRAQSTSLAAIGESKLLKSSPGRGSWPGPTALLSGSVAGLMAAAEHSKSEQQLFAASAERSPASQLSSRYLSATSGIEHDPSATSLRKNSGDSNCSHHSGASYYSAGESGGPLVADHLHLHHQQHHHYHHHHNVHTLNYHQQQQQRTGKQQQQQHHQQQQQHQQPPSQPHSTGVRLPPSRSEDTLTSSADSAGGSAAAIASTPHRKRATTITATSCSLSSVAISCKPSIVSVVSVGGASASTHSEPSLSSESEGSGADMSAASTSSATLIRQSTPAAIAATERAYLAQAATADGASVRSKRQLFEADRSMGELHISEETTEPPRRSALSVAGTSSAGSVAAGAAATPLATGIIQVYAAYETGLANGTSLKLHVTTRTTAREVVDLVVKQLNMAVVLKGKEGPIYNREKLANFCLVAVIGARERCLRDDFRPLQLQNPWRRGRLYVRQKHDVLAAIEHSNRDAQQI